MADSLHSLNMDSPLQAAVESYLLDPSPGAGRAVADACCPLVRSVLSKVRFTASAVVTEADLESAAYLGAFQALERYDLGRGVPFGGFAFPRIRGELVALLRTTDPLSRRRRRLLARAGAAADRLRQELGADAPAWRVAEAVGLSVKEYDALRADARARFKDSLDERRDDGVNLIDCIAATDEAGDAREGAWDRQHLDSMLGALPEREERALRGVLYDGASYASMGTELALSSERVRDLVGDAISRLKAMATVSGLP